MKRRKSKKLVKMIWAILLKENDGLITHMAYYDDKELLDKHLMRLKSEEKGEVKCIYLLSLQVEEHLL